MATINDVWTAYDEAQGRWSGCNWPTHYGGAGLDLDGISASQAHQSAERWRAIAAGEVAGADISAAEEVSLADMALHLRLAGVVAFLGEGQSGHLAVCGNPARRFAAESLAREWEFAADWLAEIESDAHWAQEEAQEAVHAAEDGDWEHALGRAGQACSIESGYHAPWSWRGLKRAIEKAAR